MTVFSNDPSSLCATAKVVARVLDGAVERAMLIDAEDGTIVHMNAASANFLFTGDDASTDGPLKVTDFLVTPPDVNDWKLINHCHCIMANGKTTRSTRNIHWVPMEACPCCARLYYTCYICSKHERVRDIVDHALDPVLTIDHTGTVCTFNDAACELFGYTEGEMVGQNISKICGGGHAEHHDEYLQSYLTSGIAKIIGKKREVPARKKDGTEFPCELGVQEISDASSGKRYFTGFLKDLTVIKQHEAAIQEKQDLQQGMINASTDSMFEIDQHGIIQIVNNAACSMFGFSRDEFLGSNISMICGGEGVAEKHDSYIQRYLQTGEKHIIGRKRQVKARRKDGSELEVELSVEEVILKTGKKAFCGFIKDLTAQKKDKRALRKQQQMIHGKFFGAEEG